MLDRYAEEVESVGPPDPSLAVAVEPRDPVAEVLHAGSAWNAARRRWAATGALAAVFQGPYLQRPAPLQIYIDAVGPSGLVAAAKEAHLEPAPGGRLTLRRFPSAVTASMSGPVDNEPGVWCVTWPRTYGDLRLVGVRGEEAADHLRDLRLPKPGRLHAR